MCWRTIGPQSMNTRRNAYGMFPSRTTLEGKAQIVMVVTSGVVLTHDVVIRCNNPGAINNDVYICTYDVLDRYNLGREGLGSFDFS